MHPRLKDMADRLYASALAHHSQYRPYIAQQQWIPPNYASSGERTSSDGSHQGNYDDDDLDSTFDDDLKNDTNSSTSNTNDPSGTDVPLAPEQGLETQSKEHTLRFARDFIRRQHQSLVSLYITKWMISVPKMNMLIRNCPRLEQLFLRSVEIVPVNSSFNTAAFPDLQDSTAVLDFREIKGIHIDQIGLRINRLSFRGQGLESTEFEPYIFFTHYTIFNSLRPFTWSFPNTKSLTYISKGRYIHDTEVGNAIQYILTSCSPGLHHRVHHDCHSNRNSNSSYNNRSNVDSRQQTRRSSSHDISRRSPSVTTPSAGHSSRQLSVHLERLEVLDLVGCGGLSRLNLHQILVRCEDFKVFRGPESMGRIFAEMADTTSVKAVLAQESTRWSTNVILNQIEQQQGLEVLNLRGDLDYHLADDCRKGIQLVLNAGLDKLRDYIPFAKLGESDHEDSPSTDMAGHTFLSQGQGNNTDPAFGLGLGTTNSLAGVFERHQYGQPAVSDARSAVALLVVDFIRRVHMHIDVQDEFIFIQDEVKRPGEKSTTFCISQVMELNTWYPCTPDMACSELREFTYHNHAEGMLFQEVMFKKAWNLPNLRRLHFHGIAFRAQYNDLSRVPVPNSWKKENRVRNHRCCSTRTAGDIDHPGNMAPSLLFDKALLDHVKGLSNLSEVIAIEVKYRKRLN
ncbi:hypothetical protein KI688_006952 [Linnemannia hyalina]|uniref:Uncharacterized protein n=1 Tax=Linnemannia hyalina TaxID=64524 RepID=A0A9P7XLP6_9FUNG|nr:hypothetical protein KI688_006952 [Linnemannia hyalina]